MYTTRASEPIYGVIANSGVFAHLGRHFVTCAGLTRRFQQASTERPAAPERDRSVCTRGNPSAQSD